MTEGTVKEKIGEGHELRLYEIYSRLSKENEVHIIQPAREARTWTKAGITFHDLSPLRGRLGRYMYDRHYYLSRYLHAINAPRVVKKIHPEVVDIFGFVLPTLTTKPAIVGSFAHFEKRPEIGRFRSFIASWTRNRLTNVKLRKSDFVVMMSKYTERQLGGRTSELGKEFSYVPNGVNHDLFYPRDVRQSRKALGLQQDTHLLLLLGQLVETKRPMDFLESFTLLPESYHGVIVGRGPLREKIEGYIKENSLQDRILIAGYVEKEKLPLYYSSADVAVYMGEAEIQPLVPQESMACGTPAVVSDVTGNNEMVLDGVTGRLFKPRDLKQFVEVVREICEKSDVRERMGKAGLDFMHERNWDNTVALTFQAYQKATAIAAQRRQARHL